MSAPISNRYDFVFYFDVENGNPNGDPDAGNMPRIDPETGIGIVSDVCLKRKVRNYVDLVKGEPIDAPAATEGELGYKIYIQDKTVLNERNKLAYIHNDIKPVSKKLPAKVEEQRKVTQFMCDNFYDIRAFGAVMTTRYQLRTGSWTCANVLLPVRGSRGTAGDEHHSNGGNEREGP